MTPTMLRQRRRVGQRHRCRLLGTPRAAPGGREGEGLGGTKGGLVPLL